MSTGNNPRIPGLPKAGHHRMRMTPCPPQEVIPGNPVFPYSSGIACNLRHVPPGTFYAMKPRLSSWAYVRIQENEL